MLMLIDQQVNTEATESRPVNSDLRTVSLPRTLQFSGSGQIYAFPRGKVDIRESIVSFIYDLILELMQHKNNAHNAAKSG